MVELGFESRPSNSRICIDHSAWRPDWGCREGDPDMDVMVLQRLSKLAKVKEEINAEGYYIILLKEIYHCAPELCPIINGPGSKINRPST